MKSAAYWRKRFELIEQAQHQTGAQAFSEIEAQYRKAQRQIESQINAWYGRFASNNGITIQEARRMLTARELKELKWDVQEYIKYGEENAINSQWVKELENASARFHISRLEALKLQTQQSLEVMFGDQLDTLDQTMRDVYKSGYYRTVYEVQRGCGVGWDFATLDDKQISKVINKPWATDGSNFSQRVWSNRQKLVNELNQTLTQNIVLGQDPQKAIDAIAKKMNTSKVNAGRLVMTEEAFFSSAAQKDCFAELDVEQFEIVATLDSHTSEICQDMDGKHFPMSQWEVGVTAPPFHVNCRTTTVPYFDDDFDLVGERAARGEDGKTYHVPADMTYKQWKEQFVDGGDKSELNKVEPDMKFSTKPGTTISPKQKYEDTMTVISAYDDLPVKVKRRFRDVGFEFGYDGSACDIKNKIIRVGMGASKEEIYHEMGHLIENYMMNTSDVQKYKNYLVAGLGKSDIIKVPYYDSVGNVFDVFVLQGGNFESEYQSRLYVADISQALNADGSINTMFLGETISEPFRKYMNGETISDFIKKILESVIL